MLGCDWQQQANQLTLSTASTLLLTHLLQNYANVQWKLPVVTGGLSPFVLRNVLAFIEENLGQPLTLADLAAQAALSEYHFARMFRQSTGWRRISTLCNGAWKKRKTWCSIPRRR